MQWLVIVVAQLGEIKGDFGGARSMASARGGAWSSC